jgi:hypothetical protein
MSSSRVWMLKWSMPVIYAAFALAACGGDDAKTSNNSPDSGNGTPANTAPDTPSTPSTPSTPAITAFIYEGLTPDTSRAQFLSSLNTQGAQGYRYLSDFAFTATATLDQTSAFVKDQATTYSYEVQDVTSGSAAFLTQANSEGARGFRWAGELAVGTDMFFLYRKDNGSIATYSYQVLTQPASKTDFLTQANAQGAQGYYNLAPAFILGDASTSSIYEKSSQGNATYGYEITAVPTDDTSFMTQLNSEGARGYRFRGEFVFSDGTGAIFAKELSQSATFNFYGLDPATTSATFIQQANVEGAKGNGLVGGFVLPSGKIQTLYFTPGNCKGALCTPVSLFGV